MTFQSNNAQSATNKKVAVVYNSDSGFGGGEGELKKEIEKLRDEGYVVDEKPLPKKEGEISRLFHEVASGAYDVVVACGGDGTVNGLAGELVGKDMPLLVIPMGTFNHFAKHIEIPEDLGEAFDVLKSGEIKSIDTGEVNGRPFVNFSSVGVYTEVIRERIRRERIGKKKWPSFVYSLVKNVYRHRLLDVLIKRGEGEAHERTPFIFVGNNPFLFGPRGILQGRESFTLGVLHIVIANEMGRYGLFKLFWSVLLRDFGNAKNFHSVHLQKFEIQSQKKSLHVSIDGEVVRLKTPLVYKIRPQSLRVLVPRGSE